MEHRNITGLDALHPFSIRQAIDPGAIGADKGWLDTSVDPPVLRVRNSTNTGWDVASGARGPAGAGGPIPIVDTVAERDVLYPAPAIDDAAIVKALGYSMRFGTPATGAGTWLPEQQTRSGGPVATSNAEGLIGNGVADDTPFLQAADDKMVATGGRHELDLGSFNPDGIAITRVYVNSNLTLAAHFRPNPGIGRIYVGAGKMLTINGDFDPAKYTEVFDHTMPGTVVFGRSRNFWAPWGGVKGDDLTDDEPAIDWMVATLPQQSNIVFPNDFRCRVKRGILLESRRGVRLRGEGVTFPDGGAEISWYGPRGLHGLDLTTNAGSPIVASASGEFTQDHVGQLFESPQAFGKSYGAARVLSVQSATQLTLDRNVINTVAGVGEYWVAAQVIAVHSSDNAVVENITVRPMPNAAACPVGCWIDAGSAVLNFKGWYPAPFLRVGGKILVYGAGPGGKALVSTILNYDGVSTATLNDVAATAISTNVLTTAILGPDDFSLPTLIGVDLDHSAVNGCPGTSCELNNVLVVTAGCSVDYRPTLMSVAKSAPTESDNQEYHKIRFPSLQGNGNVRQIDGGVGSGFSSTAASAVVHWTDGIIKNDIGSRFRMPNAGVGGGELDSKIIDVDLIAKTLTLLNAATGTVPNVRAQIGDATTDGFVVGSSANAKRIELLGTTGGIQFCNRGVWQKNGSVYLHTPSFSSNEVDMKFDNTTESIVVVQPNSEASRRALDTVGMQMTILSPRWNSTTQVMNGGYIKCSHGHHNLVIHGIHLDNGPTLVESTATVLEATTEAEGTSGSLDIVGIFASTVVTRAQFLGSVDGTDVGAPGLYVRIRGSQGITIMADEWNVATNSAGNQQLMESNEGAFMALAAPSTFAGNVVPDARVVNGQAVPFTERADGGGSRWRYGHRVRLPDASIGNFYLAPNDWVQLDAIDGDVAAHTIDPSLGNYFTLDTVLAAVAFHLAVGSKCTRGQKITVRIYKSAGAALVTTWDGSYKIKTWTDPAVGHISVIELVYDKEFTQLVQVGGTMDYS
ncbi:MAG: hypothetical protein ACRDQZ_13065 [Mycobacteriales bacterium]